MKWVQRHSRNILANWWWTVDHKLLAAISVLLVIGVSLVFSASPAVATRLDVESFYFVKKQVFFAVFAYCAMLIISMLNLRTIRRFAFLGYLGAIFLMIVILFIGIDAKGAARWIDLGFIRLQPSEFAKPFFVVVAAWLFDMQKKIDNFPGNALSIMFCALTAVLLFFQPDLGMTLVVCTIWAFQFFLAGLSLTWVLVLGLLLVVGLVVGYMTYGHVRERIDQFLSSDNNLTYQIKLSLEAFESGSLFGRGPGEGVVKLRIPDAHTDFIFSVAGEEYGVLVCLLIIAIFAYIVIKTMLISLKDKNLFIVLTSAGLSASFGLQGIINMASTMRLGPTKGMALPFVSYGGSSLLATSVLLGMLLAITRKNVSAEDRDYE